MKWIRERDTLIAQTLAFVQTMTGKKEDVGKPMASLDTARPDLDFASLDAIRDALDIVESPTEAFKQAFKNTRPKSMQIARPIVPSELQREIQGRIEGFRAHQERFNRERAEYFNATLARLRASLQEAAARSGK